MILHFKNNKNNESSIDEFKDKVVNMNTINNYKVNMTIDLSMDIKDMSFNTYSKGNGIIDEINQKQFMFIDTTTMGFTLNTEASNYIDLKTILNKFNDKSSVKKITNEKYKVKFTKQEIDKIINSTQELPSISIEDDIKALVYIKNKYVYRIEYDFSNVISDVKIYKITIEFSDYNEAGEVNIPTEVILNSEE